MKEREYLEGLYDTYKNLLTDREREYFENYFYEDYNLQEMRRNMDESDQEEFDKFIEENWGSSSNYVDTQLVSATPVASRRGRKPKQISE